MRNMNRRGFLGSTAAGLAAAGQGSAQPQSGNYLTETRRTPIVRKTDVLVVGGGPTGVGAALAAAKEGASVVVLERFGMLGGVWTAGLLNPFFDPEKGWIVGQLTGRLK